MKLEDFTNLYSLSKTLRFELRPIGKTRENIENGGLLRQDEDRAEKYVHIKKLIDEYHKAYIDKQLSGLVLQYADIGKANSLEEYYHSTRKSKDSDKDKIVKIQDNLRKQIVKRLKDSDEFKRIDKKELIQSDLAEFIKPAEDRALIAEFKNFTTYFTGFNENRQNMYSDKAISTAIAYRLIHENLPKFIDNIETFDRIAGITELYDQTSSDAEIFRLEHFSETLSQKQIDAYNSVMGRYNMLINEYNQTHKQSRLPKFKMLYKQILSDREHPSWLPEQFESDTAVLTAIRECYDDLRIPMANLKTLLEGLGNYDPSGIFLRNDQHLSQISKRLTGDRSSIERSVTEDLLTSRRLNKRKSRTTDEEESRKLFKQKGSLSIGYIADTAKIDVERYFAKLGAINTVTEQSENLFAKAENARTTADELLANDYPAGKRLVQSNDDIALLKNLLDALMELQWFVKPLLGTGDEAGKDERFYGEFAQIWEQLDRITPLYNMVRNYVTRKPYSTDKFKLNFESAALLGGWDKNKEPDCLSVILRKDEQYYLGIINKNHKKIFARDILPCEGERYEKMVYKQISISAGIGGFFRKCYRTAEQYGWCCSDSCLNDERKIIIRDDEARENLTEIINCQKDFLNKYEKDGFKYRDFGFRFAASSDYEKLSDFYRDIDEQRYKLSFTPVSATYIDSLVEEGKLYLFQIYNKDFSAYSKGTPNMHTLYWRMLFDERNLSDVVYQLNGGAELFFRRKSLQNGRPTHPANIPIKNKNSRNDKKESLFDYDLIKDRRYTVDKFQFHVPITLNFKSDGAGRINERVREYLRSADDVHVIGIDRGERNLLYLVVTDMDGNICEQFSLNEICNTDYHSLLDEREHKRMQERQSWQAIEGIKELKEGYLSQVVHRIATLLVKYRAIVVLEDLNFGFMRSRQKVEKSVYQKFEHMLIDKLNYLVDKKANPTTPGGLLKAYQLTDKFESFQKLGKQSGFLFYVPAWNTSKIDPATGFVNMLDLGYESIDKAKALLCKFDSIRYNACKDWFEFALDYDKFGSKATGTRTKWTVCTYGQRIDTYRNKDSQWVSRDVDLTNELKSLFSEHGIDIYSNLKDAIVAQNDKEFFANMQRILKLTMQMRNSKTGTDTDYIVSPVADANGRFFDSRQADATMPKDADANGAYNIARKGIMLVQQIKQSDDLRTMKFDISNKSWLRFVQHTNQADE